jgi:transketolase
MRNNFFNALFEIAKNDPNVVLITADMGFGLFEKFRDQLPRQFINAGVSEANAMTMAAGMAIAGKKPYVYSITPFITYRCFEQIRLDVCYQNVNVKIIGSGGGLDYGQDGTTHHPTEDISVMRSLPNMKVVCPADPLEAAVLPSIISNIDGPVFVRLGKGKEMIHSFPPTMEIGKANKVYQSKTLGRPIVVFATGDIIANAYQAAVILDKEDVPIRLYSVPWIKPFDEKAVLEEIPDASAIVTVEEHSRIGGLFSSVCETLVSNNAQAKVISIALPDAFQKEVGDQAQLRKINGLDVESLKTKLEGIEIRSASINNGVPSFEEWQKTHKWEEYI